MTQGSFESYGLGDSEKRYECTTRDGGTLNIDQIEGKEVNDNLVCQTRSIMGISMTMKHFQPMIPWN
jgi:hypothetical protein